MKGKKEEKKKKIAQGKSRRNKKVNFYHIPYSIRSKYVDTRYAKGAFFFFFFFSFLFFLKPFLLF